MGWLCELGGGWPRGGVFGGFCHFPVGCISMHKRAHDTAPARDPAFYFGELHLTPHPKFWLQEAVGPEARTLRGSSGFCGLLDILGSVSPS